MEPKIRFKGFEGEWNTSKLGDIATFSKGSGYSKSDLCKDGSPVVLYGRMYTKYQSIIDEIDTFVAPKANSVISTGGEVVIPGSGESPEDISLAATIKNAGVIIGGDLNILKFNRNNNDPAFMSMAITYSPTRSELSNYSQGKTVVHLRNSEIAKGTVYFPKIEEQKVIVNYVLSLDSQISACTSRLASLKQMKAASLQAMFPQEGETVPKIRFKGFEGEWKKVSFKDFTFHAGAKNRDNLPLESYSISNEFGFIPQNEQFENGGTMTQADKRMYYIVSPNSFAYNPARINVGSLGYYEGNEDVIVSSLYEVFKTDDTICDRFLLYWFKTNIFQKMIEQFQEGGVRLYFFYDKMCKCSLKKPSLAEQQAIASYFTSLDHQISLQSQRLEKLKQIKSACLDKMFV